jgi:hypothetical protein
MFRSVSLAALLFSLALDAAAYSGSDTSVAESSVALLSEPSVLLLIGFALITASRVARR